LAGNVFVVLLVSQPGSSWTTPGAHGGHQLVELGVGRLGVGAGDGVGHAVAHMAVEHVDRDLLQRGLDRGHLGEDVDAVGVLVDHPLQAADLAFDPAQAIVEGLGVRVHSPSIPTPGTGDCYPAPSRGQSAGGKGTAPPGAAGA
jgi:hypothetical protein